MYVGVINSAHSLMDQIPVPVKIPTTRAPPCTHVLTGTHCVALLISPLFRAPTLGYLPLICTNTVVNESDY